MAFCVCVKFQRAQKDTFEAKIDGWGDLSAVVPKLGNPLARSVQTSDGWGQAGHKERERVYETNSRFCTDLREKQHKYERITRKGSVNGQTKEPFHPSIWPHINWHPRFSMLDSCSILGHASHGLSLSLVHLRHYGSDNEFQSFSC